MPVINTDRFKQLLTEFVWGSAAENIFVDDQSMVSPGFTYALPLFVPKSNVMISWNVPLFGVVSEGELLKAKWTVTDSRTGSLNGSYVVGSEGVDVAGQVIPVVVTEYLTKRAGARLVSSMRKEGNLSKWELLTLLERSVRAAVLKATYRVAAEINGDVESSVKLLDDSEVESVSAEIIFGREGEDSSILIRMLERVVANKKLSNVDVFYYLNRNLFSNAESAVRRFIHDPAVGRKLRALVRGMDSPTLESVISEHNRMYPENRVGAKRVLNALTAGRTINANSVSMTDWIDFEWV